MGKLRRPPRLSKEATKRFREKTTTHLTKKSKSRTTIKLEKMWKIFLKLFG